MLKLTLYQMVMCQIGTLLNGNVLKLRRYQMATCEIATLPFGNMLPFENNKYFKKLFQYIKIINH
jgi:hypothetical protein